LETAKISVVKQWFKKPITKLVLAKRVEVKSMIKRGTILYWGITLIFITPTNIHYPKTDMLETNFDIT
jgi:hypothetical protein